MIPCDAHFNWRGDGTFPKARGEILKKGFGLLIIIHENWVGARKLSSVDYGDGGRNNRRETVQMNGDGEVGGHTKVIAGMAGKAESSGFRLSSGSTEIVIGS